MGIAASLFYDSNDSERQTLLKRCTPSDEQFDEQQQRWNELATHLKDDLKKRSGHPIRTWLQGSYKFHTQVRPVRASDEFDIDLGVYFEWPGSPEDGTHGATTLKSFIQDSLKSFTKANSETIAQLEKPKQRCCRIQYKNNFHIDVPGYHLDAEKDARTLTTTKGWEPSDPKAIYVWFRDKFDDNSRAKVRRQIRYFKTWAALKIDQDDGRPSSILLTVLITEAAAEIGTTNFGADDEFLREILSRIVARLANKMEVSNPVAASEDLNRLIDKERSDFLKALRKFLGIATRANACETQFEAADIWQEAFDHMFPMPEPEVVSADLSKSASKNAVAVILPEIRVTATYRSNPLLSPKTSMNAIGPIPKGCELRFEITNASLMPPGTEFYWIVRNEGREAELSNDLGHLAGIGVRVSRNSAYKGTHYMDCAAKVAGRTLALRRVPVTITGLSMPPRTPPRRRFL